MNEQVNLNDVVRITNPDYPDFVLQGLVQGIYGDGDMRLEGTEAYTEALMSPEAYRGRQVEVIRRAKRELPTEDGLYYARTDYNHNKGPQDKRLFQLAGLRGWSEVTQTLPEDTTEAELRDFLEERLNGSNPWTLVRLVPEGQRGE